MSVATKLGPTWLAPLVVACAATACATAGVPTPEVPCPPEAPCAVPPEPVATEVAEPEAPPEEAPLALALARTAEGLELTVEGQGLEVCLGTRCEVFAERVRFDLPRPSAPVTVGQAWLPPLAVDGEVVDPEVVALDSGIVLSGLPSPRRLSDLRAALFAPFAATRVVDAGALRAHLAATDEPSLDALEALLQAAQAAAFARFGALAGTLAIGWAPSDEPPSRGPRWALLTRASLPRNAGDAPALLEALAASLVQTPLRTLPTEPHVVEPHVVEPHVIEPHVIEPHVVEPHVVEPNVSPNVGPNVGPNVSPNDPNATSAAGDETPRWLRRGFGRYGAWLLGADLRRAPTADALHVLARAYERHRARIHDRPLAEGDDPDGAALVLFCTDLALRRRGSSLAEQLAPSPATLEARLRDAEPPIGERLAASLAFRGVLDLDACLRPHGLRLVARRVNVLAPAPFATLFDGATVEGLVVRRAPESSRLREGDVLVRLGDVPIVEPSDVDLALFGHTAGHRVTSVWVRGDREIRVSLPVPFGASTVEVRFVIEAMDDAALRAPFPFATSAR